MGAVQSKKSSDQPAKKLGGQPVISKRPEILNQNITQEQWVKLSKNTRDYLIKNAKQIQLLLADGYLTPENLPNDDAIFKLTFLIPNLIGRGLIVPLSSADKSGLCWKSMTCAQALKLPNLVLLDLDNDTVCEHIKNDNITIYDINKQYDFFAKHQQDEKSRYDLWDRYIISLERNLQSDALKKLIDEKIYHRKKTLYYYNYHLDVLEMPGVVDLIVSKKNEIFKEQHSWSDEDRKTIRRNFKQRFIKKILVMDERSLQELESQELRNKIITGKLQLDEIAGFSILPQVIEQTTIQYIEDLIKENPEASLKFIGKIDPSRSAANLVQVKYDLNTVHDEMAPRVIQEMKSRLGEASANKNITKLVDVVYPGVAIEKTKLDELRLNAYDAATNRMIRRDLNFQRSVGGLFSNALQENSNQSPLLLKDIDYGLN